MIKNSLESFRIYLNKIYNNKIYKTYKTYLKYYKTITNK